MTFFPVQKLTIGELFVAVAAGLMLFLLPNDAKNQINDIALAEGYVFLFSLMISAALLLTLKRYDALGIAIFSNSIFTIISFGISILNGVITKGMEFWPQLSEYQLITMFISWVVPFFFAVSLRMLSRGSRDTNDSRMRFSHFLVFAIRALMMVYLLVIIFRHLLPFRPHMSEERLFNLTLFSRIRECLDGAHENGIIYIWWHCLLLSPLTFSLLILNPKIKWWHLSIICLASGITLEILQFCFNTGTVCIDDIWMYLVGGTVGMLLKCFIDLIRSVLTQGQDKCMLSFGYTLVSGDTRTKINDSGHSFTNQQKSSF